MTVPSWQKGVARRFWARHGERALDEKQAAPTVSAVFHQNRISNELRVRLSERTRAMALGVGRVWRRRRGIL